MTAHLLIVDPDASCQELLAFNLGMAGYGVSRARDGASALLLMEAAVPDLLLLDWSLPGQSGIALMRRLRAQAHTRELPIIMLTARAAEQDKILALETGADDYITKPFSPRETLARVHALLRRRQPLAAPGTVQMAGLRLDPATLQVTAGARPLVLGRLEFKLLNFLMHHPERVHSRARLLDHVWGHAACLDERTVDAHVGRLRSALQPSGHQHHIETVRGSGYRFVARQEGRAGGARGMAS
ncbi:MAG TPA: response regulator [Burkholderiaceae bacterium]|nr:response regulator [Burkholderiaceae bacterium]